MLALPRATTLAIATVLLFSSLTLAALPNPTAGVTAIGVDAAATDDPFTYGSLTWNEPVSDPAMYQGGSLTYNGNYDLTVFDITNGSSTAFLCEPRNDVAIAQATAYHPADSAGSWNVTFPNAFLNETGVWHVNATGCGAGAQKLDAFFVSPTQDLSVSLSPSSTDANQNSVVIDITVAGLNGGETATLAADFLPAGARVNASAPTFEYAGAPPTPGTHRVKASVDSTGDATPERVGYGDLVVTGSEPTANVTITPGTITTRYASVLDVLVDDQNNNPIPDARLVIVRADGSNASADFTGATSAVGNGTAGNGQNGHYDLRLTPHVVGAYRVDVTIGHGPQSPGGTRYGSASFDVVLPTPTFKLTNASGGMLYSIAMPLTLTDVADLGTATLTVQFDASVVAIDNVTNGNVSGSTLSWNVANGTLTLLVTTSGVPGPSGDATFATLRLHAVGPAGSTSALRLRLVEAAHSDGSAFDAATVDGHFRAGILGDADGDGNVTAHDAEVIADYVVGKATSIVSGNADLNADGRVTGVDAMMLRQFLAGTRATLG